MTNKLKIIFISSILALPTTAFADDYLKDFGQFDLGNGSLFEMIAPILLNVISFLLSIAGFITVIYIIYSGYLLITASGNEQEVEKGKKGLTNAIIGFVVALSGVVIVQTIKNWLLTPQ